MFKNLQQIKGYNLKNMLTEEQKQWIKDHNMIYTIIQEEEKWSYRGYDSWNDLYVITIYDKDYYDNVYCTKQSHIDAFEDFLTSIIIILLFMFMGKVFLKMIS